MAILITGGHGHLGAWIALHLAQAGQRAILFDLNPAQPDQLTPVSDRIEHVRGDVLDFPRLADTIRGRDIDGIIHTVGVMGEMVLDNPHHNVRLNIGGTHNILELARQFAIPKVVYTGTGAVYSANAGSATEDSPTAPADLYGATKLSAEHLGRQYADAFGFEFRVGRVYFCYGPGKLPSRFIRLYRLVFGALEGLSDLKLDRGADQKLDFTYIEDAARGIALLYQANDPPHTVYNIATGVALSLADMVDLVGEQLGGNAGVKLGRGKIMQRCEALDITRARNELGFEPKIEPREGIRRYADWLRAQGA